MLFAIFCLRFVVCYLLLLFVVCDLFFVFCLLFVVVVVAVVVAAADVVVVVGVGVWSGLVLLLLLLFRKMHDSQSTTLPLWFEIFNQYVIRRFVSDFRGLLLIENDPRFPVQQPEPSCPHCCTILF